MDLEKTLDGIYFKIYLNKNDLLTVVCLQWFDEYDYDFDRFYKEDGSPVIFTTEKAAIDFLVKTFKKEFIAEEYHVNALDWDSMKRDS